MTPEWHNIFWTTYSNLTQWFDGWEAFVRKKSLLQGTMMVHCASVMSGDESSASTIAIALTEALVEGKPAVTVTKGVPANQKLQQTKVIGKKAANNQPRLKKKENLTVASIEPKRFCTASTINSKRGTDSRVFLSTSVLG
jgi:hypothetical protein